MMNSSNNISEEGKVQGAINQPEEEIDLIALAKNVWLGRKTVIYSVLIAAVMGVFIALFSAKQYTVSTVMVPQIGAEGGSQLKDLASLAGFDLGGSKSSSELSPIIYPKILGSIPFKLELMNTPLHFEELDTPVTLYDYMTIYSKPSVIGTVKKYTLGLPGLIIGAIRGPQEDLSIPDNITNRPLALTKEQDKVKKALDGLVSLNVNSKEGYLTLTVSLSEPLAAAELAQKAQELLQREIIKFKIEKSQADLNFIQERYDETKKEAERYQEMVAANTDRSKSMVSARPQVEIDRIRSKYNIANSVYMELSKQLEQAKLQVKKDTPVFTVIEPVTIPIERSKPKRAQILVIWMFLGGVVGVGIVLGKQWLEPFKQKWNAAE